MKCTECNGEGRQDDGNYAYMAYTLNYPDCGLCQGKGWLTGGQAMKYARGFKKPSKKRMLELQIEEMIRRTGGGYY